MLTGIHILLSYKCLYECDHCFVYSSPNSKGTFTLEQIYKVLDEASKIGSVRWIYFEGGEPFLYYPLMLEGIKIAKIRGFRVGVVTNGYFATTEADAERWLIPLRKMKVSDLSISDDSFHSNGPDDNPAKTAIAAAKKLGMRVSSISVGEPKVETGSSTVQRKGKPVIGGDVMFRGRAADKLVNGLPLTPAEEFKECPHEDLKNPERVHVDSYGNVHLCQGLSMGNMWETPLSVLVKNYIYASHPICRYLMEGGPALLAKEYEIKNEGKFVDACHFCYTLRKSLLDNFPQYLAPKQVYGIE